MSALKSATTLMLWVILSNVYQIAVRADNLVDSQLSHQHSQQSTQPQDVASIIAQTQQQQLQQQPQYTPLESLVKQMHTKRSWQNLQSSWGKRTGQPQHTSDEYDDLSKPYESFDEESLNFAAPLYADAADTIADDQQQRLLINAKRAWKSMNSSWGKRLGMTEVIHFSFSCISCHFSFLHKFSF